MITLVELPLVLPPAVAGIGLLVAFLPDGPIGRFLHPLGIDFVFTEAGVVLAVLFVGSPFYLRAAIAAFEDARRGRRSPPRARSAQSPGRVFARIAVPLALPGLGAGAALAFGRGVGEFGATIMFAGNLQGITQTLPLAIYAAFEIEPRCRARHRRAARGVQRNDPPSRQAAGGMGLLSVELAVPLRSFRLELSLAVAAETVAIVGPSGAGKSTVLRAIAGLAEARGGPGGARGRRLVRRVAKRSNLAPEDRSVGMVFQQYALFPHLSVRAERRVRRQGAGGAR